MSRRRRASRQSAVDTLLALATDILKEGGHAPSPDMRQRLLGSLDALAAYGTGSLAPKAGRLTEDVPAPGFAALAGLAVPAPDEDAAAQTARAAAAPGREPVKLSVVARRSKEKAQALVQPGRGGARRGAGRGRPRRRGPDQGGRRLAGGPGSAARGPEGGRRRHHRRAGRPGRSRGAPPRHRPRRHRRPRRREAAGSGPPQPRSGLRRVARPGSGRAGNGRHFRRTLID